MAQPTSIEYLGALVVKAGAQYTSDSILTTYPTATVIKIKPFTLDGYKTIGVRANINGGAMFPVKYDDESFINIGKTYIFDKDCIIAVGIYKAV